MRHNIFFMLLLLFPLTSFSQENNVISIEPDNEVILHNPMNGWVIYMGRGGWESTFWTKQHYDDMPINGTTETVKVSDYASCAYLRAPWSYLEPTQGNYAWKDTSSKCYQLLKSARDRGLRLAFRILVDGRDQGQNTPEYVFDAGAKYYENTVGSRTVKSPYPDDEVFQEKYEAFIKAFAEEFNDPDVVDFVDGFGLGLWGEGHQLIFQDKSNKLSVYDWITSLYSKYFTKVPLLMNYHRVLGATNGWSDTPNVDSESMIESAVTKGYSLRHDAFGMTGYYKQWEKDIAANYFGKRPIVMEGGWVTNSHRYWTDPSGDYREGYPEDVRIGEYNASKEAHVNMMDLRVNEVPSWFENFDLVKGMCLEGGYRLYPDLVTAPKSVATGKQLIISHRWNNAGWGYCPTNIPQWNQKYKVAFALLDESGKVHKTMVATDTDLSTWLKGTPTTYESSFDMVGVATGKYTLATGLVDVTKDNAIGLQMAVDPNKLMNGWYPLTELEVTVVPESIEDVYFVRSDDDVHLAAEGRDGTSWDTALKFSDFYNKINDYKTGDTFYFAGGTYYVPSVKGITKGYTFVGGFNPELTGTDTALPSYPSSTPTVITCKESNKLARLLCLSAASNEPFRLTGLELTGAYFPSATSDNAMGALWVRDRNDVVVNNCRFYNNTSDSEYGGMAFRGEYSKVKFVDCEFFNNSAGARGGAIRLSDGGKKNGYTTFESCAIYDNSVTKGTGSAICVQHGQALYIINSTIANNSSSVGGAIYNNNPEDIYKRAIYVVNSTIAGNSNSQIQISKIPNLYIVNSIIVGKEADKETAIVVDSPTASGVYGVFSGGYNILGSYSNTLETPEWDSSDVISENNTYESVLANTLAAGAIEPENAPNGATVEELEDAVSAWGTLPGEDNYLETDQKGNARGNTTPGALAVDGIKGQISITDVGVATYYNDYGYTIPSGLKGYFITTYNDANYQLSLMDMYHDEALVPAKSALVVKGNEGSYDVDLKLSKTYNGEVKNWLLGTQTDATTVSELGNAQFYKLANGAKGLGFYWGEDNGAAFTNHANRAYLAIPGPSLSKYYLLFNPTGIDGTVTDTLQKNKVCYTLQGIRTSRPATSGIYISDGKKILVK